MRPGNSAFAIGTTPMCRGTVHACFFFSLASKIARVTSLGVLQRPLEDVLALADSRVVDEKVEPSPFAARELDRATCRLGIGDVGHEHLGFRLSGRPHLP